MPEATDLCIPVRRVVGEKSNNWKKVVEEDMN
jgi:hypothetical protein